MTKMKRINILKPIERYCHKNNHVQFESSNISYMYLEVMTSVNFSNNRSYVKVKRLSPKSLELSVLSFQKMPNSEVKVTRLNLFVPIERSCHLEKLIWNIKARALTVQKLLPRIMCSKSESLWCIDHKV